MIRDLIELRSKFSQNANQTLALNMKRYMRDQFEFFGIQAPLRRKLTSEFLQEYGFPREDQVFEVISELWGMEEREFTGVALQIMDMRKRLFHHDDIKLIEKIAVTKPGWDTLDHISANHAGHYFMLFPEKLSIADEWIHSNNIWLQRSALLFQLKYKHNTNQDRLFSYIRLLSDSQEFFIKKAIGWSLRQYSKSNKESVVQFIENNQLSNLSKREAMKLWK
ncbi:hypothetical protein PGLA_15050 [Paenibacillus glacialis]|uniref:DNA alkylation repair protein n=1 Tax=Paenibacillus glacialis TaxID=494026 RepID=A0A168KEU8_9BACL|nr:hypothetical protein PGLA_15050 [Paenibacillus glacialis]